MIEGVLEIGGVGTQLQHFFFDGCSHLARRYPLAETPQLLGKRSAIFCVIRRPDLVLERVEQVFIGATAILDLEHKVQETREEEDQGE